MNRFKIPTGLFFLLLCSACAPRYETQTIYQYPDNYRPQCFKNCKNNLFQCEKKTLNIYNKCMNEANRRSKDIFNYEMKKYKANLNNYLAKEKLYQSQKKSYQAKFDDLKTDEKYFSEKCNQTDKFACEKLVNIKHALDKLSSPLSPIKNKPEAPSFNEIIKIQSQYCHQTNICQQEYNACFTSCGGKVIYKQVCVENCDN